MNESLVTENLSCPENTNPVTIDLNLHVVHETSLRKVLGLHVPIDIKELWWSPDSVPLVLTFQVRKIGEST